MAEAVAALWLTDFHGGASGDLPQPRVARPDAGPGVGDPLRSLAPVLRDRLEARDVDVFYDEDDISELDDIKERIGRFLTRAALLVCWYSDLYRSRRACSWELTTAVTADQRRVVVVNPEASVDHVLPAWLRQTLLPRARPADDEKGWDDLATTIVERAQAIGGAFGDMASSEATRWYGDAPARFSRFVGRTEPLWELDSLLRPPPPVSGGSPPPTAVVVHGLGGTGKTALASEYAAQFAPAYGFEVFWLRAGSAGQSGDELKPALQLNSQLLTIAEECDPTPHLAPDTPTRSPEEAKRVVALHIDAQERPCLWVVDDVPPGLTADAFARWLPDSRNARALVTTQGTTYRQVPNIGDVCADKQRRRSGRPGERSIGAVASRDPRPQGGRHARTIGRKCCPYDDPGLPERHASHARRRPDRRPSR